MATYAPSLPTLADPRSRREALFRVHSALRSADRLRPDEAFDELVSLYEIWVDQGPLAISEIQGLRPRIQMSDAAIENAVPSLWAILGDRDFAAGPDLFQELADVGVRSGLGQYFTPAPAARAMAAFLRPRPGEAWLDPFCGSGLLLGEIAREAEGSVSLYGVDVDKRVLRLAAVEAKLRHPHSPLAVANVSALDKPEDVLAALGAPPGGVDGVVTNPPFGAVDLQGDGLRSDFELAGSGPTPIEILGLEQSIRLLRDGGRMGIVLPQSVFSNKRSEYVRAFLNQRLRIVGVLSLPPETFAMFKGVGKASILFLKKDMPARQKIWFGVAGSVGWDGTGRETGIEDVTDVALAMREAQPIPGQADVRPGADVLRNLTAEWHLRHQAEGLRLGDVVESVFTGRTPPRSSYCSPDAGQDVYRAIKVGNLTGSGINWGVGDRGHARFPRLSDEQALRVGDIVLTAAAHHPRYIGAKVDIVDKMPAGFEERCVPSGEVMVIRPRAGGVDPRVLLMWLRTDEGRTAIQACITGQTAHLHPDYVVDVVIPDDVLSANVSEAAEIVTKALETRREAERLAAQARELFADVVARG